MGTFSRSFVLSATSPPGGRGGGGAEKQRQQEGQKRCVVEIVLGLRFRIFAKVLKKYFRTLAKKQKKIYDRAKRFCENVQFPRKFLQNFPFSSVCEKVIFLQLKTIIC